MRLVLDPAEEAVHSGWLRGTPGAYEWWYFDALSDDGIWALTCIWFLGNPFSPYYRQSARGRPASPLDHNALFFALYHRGQLYAYHFTRFSEGEMEMSEMLPLCLKFGPNCLTMPDNGLWKLSLRDENANGRRLEAALAFTAPPLIVGTAEITPLDADHSWLPIAPACRVSGMITLMEPHNPGAQTVAFTGSGYHDHNWGRLPFDAAIRDWYWARAELPNQRAVLLYHVRPHHGPPVSHLLLFERGRLLVHDAAASVRLSRPKVNGFGTIYAADLRAVGGGLRVMFRLGTRLDSSPFYVRALCTAALERDLDGNLDGDNAAEMGRGIGEYLRPGMMAWPLVASAMKARIVER